MDVRLALYVQGGLVYAHVVCEFVSDEMPAIARHKNQTSLLLIAPFQLLRWAPQETAMSVVVWHVCRRGRGELAPLP